MLLLLCCCGSSSLPLESGPTRVFVGGNALVGSVLLSFPVYSDGRPIKWPLWQAPRNFFWEQEKTTSSPT